jgi:hypothetical protein
MDVKRSSKKENDFSILFFNAIVLRSQSSQHILDPPSELFTLQLEEFNLV